MMQRFTIRTRSRRARDRRGYTLIELLTIIVLLGIVIGLITPLLPESQDLALRESARILAADIEFARMESITHADDPRAIVFSASGGNTYWIAPVSNTTQGNAVTEEISNSPYVVQFGAGRAAACTGVSLGNYDVGGDAEIQFDALGSPDLTSKATIPLTLNGMTLTIEVAPATGEVTITSP